MLTRSRGKKSSADSIFARNDIAIFGAFCLFLCAVEYMIPKPLPFFRIGLANLPLMLACNLFSFPSFLVLVCIKVFGQALITGTLFSYVFLFSAAGTFLSALCMYFLCRVFSGKRISFIGIGTAGALISNLSQLFLAYYFIFRENVFYIAPPFLAAGLVTGIVLGVFCEVFVNKSKWYMEKMKHRLTQIIIDKDEDIKSKDFSSSVVSIFSARALFITGLIIMPALLFNPNTQFRIYQFLFFLVLACFSGRKINFLYTILITSFIIAFNLIIPYGRVLYSIGAFKITSGALEAGIHRAVTLQALVMLSKFTIRKDLMLPGAFGRLLSESLRIFSAIMGKRLHLTRRNLIAEIDALMLNLSEETSVPADANKQKTKPAGFIALVIIALMAWFPIILDYLM